MLIDEDYYARVEGREIISNLAKAAGLATMIATMRPGLVHFFLTRIFVHHFLSLDLYFFSFSWKNSD